MKIRTNLYSFWCLSFPKYPSQEHIFLSATSHQPTDWISEREWIFAMFQLFRRQVLSRFLSDKNGSNYWLISETTTSLNCSCCLNTFVNLSLNRRRNETKPKYEHTLLTKARPVNYSQDISIRLSTFVGILHLQYIYEATSLTLVNKIRHMQQENPFQMLPRAMVGIK